MAMLNENITADMIEATEFQELSMKDLITNFLMYLQEEAATVIQRRVNLNRGRGYNTLKIKENLDFVISYIYSDFD